MRSSIIKNLLFVFIVVFLFFAFGRPFTVTADMKAREVAKVKIPQYSFVTKWGSKGSGDGQFNTPFGVAADSIGKNIFVSDTLNDRIQRFDSNGNFLGKWGSKGSGNFQFNQPTGISAKNGNVYVADQLNYRILGFNQNGTSLLTKWGTQGSGNDQFLALRGIALAPSGAFIYVVDTSKNVIQKFVITGKYLLNFQSGMNRPASVAVDSAGNAYVVSADGLFSIRVKKFNSNGMPIPDGEWNDYKYGIDWGKISFGIAVDPVGNFIFSDYEKHCIWIFDHSKGMFTTLGSEGSGNGQFKNPTGVAVMLLIAATIASRSSKRTIESAARPFDFIGFMLQ